MHWKVEELPFVAASVKRDPPPLFLITPIGRLIEDVRLEHFFENSAHSPHIGERAGSLLTGWRAKRHRISSPALCPLPAADSMDRRNTAMITLGWSFVAEGLSRSF